MSVLTGSAKQQAEQQRQQGLNSVIQQGGVACLQALGIEPPPEPEPITLVDDLRNPTRLTLDQNNVYVVESVFGAVTAKKVPLQGGIPIVIATVSSCTSLGLAVDNTSVYWAGTCGSGGGEIVKAPLTGGTPTFLAGANQPSDIAIDDRFVYWAENNGGPEDTQAVRKVSISGEAVQTVTTRGVPLALVLVGSEVYFSYFDHFSASNRIGRVNKEGGGVIDLAFTVSRASGIVADATHVYWTEFDAGTVNKMPLGGGSVTTLASGLNQPWRLAVDGTNIYIIEFANAVAGAGSVIKVPVSGGEIVTLVDGLNGPTDIAGDSTHIYWTEVGTDGTDGAITKLAK